MKVKICGITNRDDALYAAEAGADALGFNFSEEAMAKGRFIEPGVAAEIIYDLPPFVTTVAISVNDPIEFLLDYLEIVDCIQLHGEEDPSLCRALDLKTIKAFRLGDASDIDDMRQYYAANAFLVDAYSPDARGGTGQLANWKLAREAKALGKPIILAGGLTPENVAEAIRAVRPYAVDTASGVESQPGIKDRERVRRFIHNAKATIS